MGDRRFPTWQWIAVTALAIIGGLGMFMITDARTSIKDLEKNKLDRVEYYQDIQDIKTSLTEIKTELHDHDKRARRYNGD